MCALVCLSFCAYAEEKPLIANDEIINTIQLLEIANGDDNGNMNYEKPVTRAEFVKMAVTASPNKEKAQNSLLSYSLFPDVKNTFWGAGYISVAIESGLVNGYLDGTFRPSNEVTLEEAATIVLRLLGYTSSDFAGNYPSSQIEKYKELKLDENIYAKTGDKLTREECMILLYNMLCTKNKTGQVYCTVLGYTANINGKLDYSALLEKKLEDPFILDDETELTKLVKFELNDKTDYRLNNAYAQKEDIKSGDVIYYSDKINTVFSFRKTATGIVAAVTADYAVTLSNGKSYLIKTTTAKNKLSLGGKYNEKNSFVTLLLGLNDEVIDVLDGDVSRLAENSDNASYISMIDATISLPIYIKDEQMLDSWKNSVPFDTEISDIYVNGELTEKYTPTVSDVLYYSKPFKGIWVYRETKTGNISVITQSAISIGTDTYSIATNEAKLKVSTYGEFKKDDYVTLILGKNDEVINIIAANPDEIGKNENDSSYSDVVSSSLKGPYVVNADGSMDKLTLDIDSCVIYKSNTVIEKNKIQPYDVYYFSPVLNTLWIYRDTVSGTIEEITPVAAPVSVILSGNTYGIETSQASFDLSSFGSFGIGDKATLLLDMNGKVAGVVGVDTVSKVYYGVVTGRGSKAFKNKDGSEYTSDYVTVTDTSCQSYTYEHSNRSLGIGDIVRVSVGETVKLTEQSTNLGRNNLATVINALNNKKYAPDCKIIEIYGSKVEKVYPSRFDGVKLDLDSFMYSSSVLYFKIDDNNNLSELILNNFTGDMYQYGVVSSASPTQLTYMTDNVKRTFAVSGISCSEGPAVIYSENGVVSGIKNLLSYVEKTDFITKTAVFDEDDKEYPLSEDVKVFLQDGGTYKHITLEDALESDYTFTAYYDKTPEKGGRIRVIIATKYA